jgi:hypothetical protein
MSGRDKEEVVPQERRRSRRAESRADAAWQVWDQFVATVASVAAPESLSIVRDGSSSWEMQKRGQGVDEISQRLKLIRSKRFGTNGRVGPKQDTLFRHPMVRPGDIILLRTPGKLYKLARTTAQNPFDHVVIVMKSGAQVLHVSPPEARLLPLSKVMEPKFEPLALRPSLGPAELEIFLSSAENVIGTRYNSSRTFALLFRLGLEAHAGIQPSKPLTKRGLLKNGAICTDVVLSSLCHASVEFHNAVMGSESSVSNELDYIKHGAGSLRDLIRINQHFPRMLRYVNINKEGDGRHGRSASRPAAGGDGAASSKELFPRRVEKGAAFFEQMQTIAGPLSEMVIDSIEKNPSVSSVLQRLGLAKEVRTREDIAEPMHKVALKQRLAPEMVGAQPLAAADGKASEASPELLPSASTLEVVDASNAPVMPAPLGRDVSKLKETCVRLPFTFEQVTGQLWNKYFDGLPSAESPEIVAVKTHFENLVVVGGAGQPGYRVRRRTIEIALGDSVPHILRTVAGLEGSIELVEDSIIDLQSKKMEIAVQNKSFQSLGRMFIRQTILPQNENLGNTCLVYEKVSVQVMGVPFFLRKRVHNLLVEGIRKNQENSANTLFKKLAARYQDATHAVEYSPGVPHKGNREAFLNSSIASAFLPSLSVNEGSDRAVPTVGVEEKGRGGNHGPEKRVQLQWDRILVSVGLIGAVLLARGAKVLVRKIIRSVLLVFFLYEVGMNFASFPRSTPGNKLGLVVAKGRQTMSEISSGRWGPSSLERELVHAKL